MKRHDEIDVAAGQNWSPLGLSRGLNWAIGQPAIRHVVLCCIYSDKMKKSPTSSSCDDRQVILEFDGDALICECFEKREYELCAG